MLQFSDDDSPFWEEFPLNLSKIYFKVYSLCKIYWGPIYTLYILYIYYIIYTCVKICLLGAFLPGCPVHWFVVSLTSSHKHWKANKFFSEFLRLRKFEVNKRPGKITSKKTIKISVTITRTKWRLRSGRGSRFQWKHRKKVL